MKLFVATTNSGKLTDFAVAAAVHSIEVEPLPALNQLPAPVEDAVTFAGNADLKAVAYSTASPGLLVLCDDSGLEVDALGGRPGVLSARFAETLGFAAEANLPRDARNNLCLLSLLHEVDVASGGRAGRGARFICALSLARDGKILLRAEGSVEGDLAEAPHGDSGFGYDPLFVLRDRGVTLAQLDREEKWTISHRGRAFRSLLQQLSPKDGLHPNPLS